MSNVIKEKGDFKLLRPLNSWDTNYHLIDVNNGLDHLIDIDDVYSGEDDEFEGISWSDLISLDDIEYILEYVWKTIESSDY